MALSYREELRRTFDLAALRIEAQGIKTPRQWRKADMIKKRSEEARKLVKKTYAGQYATRVEIARRRIINEAGSKTRDFQHPWGARDKFSIADTLRQAQREVRAEREQRIGKINDFERRELRILVKQSMRENNLRGKPREAFKRAANRRNGIERRQFRPRKRER